MSLVKYAPKKQYNWKDYALAAANDPYIQGKALHYGKKAGNYLLSKAKGYLSGSKKSSASRSAASAGGVNTSMVSSRKSSKRRRSRQIGSSPKHKQRVAYDLMTYMQPPQRYLETYAAFGAAATGQQAVTEFSFMDYQDMRDVQNNLQAPSPNTAFGKILFDQSYVRVEATNSSSQPVIGCVYVIKSRRDSTLSAYNSWATSMPLVQGTPYPSVNSYGATPYMGPALTSRFKITGQFGFHLNSGEQREWQFNMRKGQFNFANLEASIENYRGWTTSIIICAWGSTVHDTNTTANVSTAPIRIDYVVNEYYSYRNIVVTQPYMYAVGGPDSVTVPRSYLNTGVSALSTAT